MKKIALFLTLLICMAAAAYGQKLLILERPGATKHHIFKTGNAIRLFDGRSMRVVHGAISSIADSMITINTLEPVYLSRITTIYRPLKLLRRFSNAATVAGIGYFLLTGFNNAINHKSPLIDHGTLVTSAVITPVGVATSYIRYRKFTIGPHWRLKVIDMNNPGK